MRYLCFIQLLLDANGTGIRYLVEMHLSYVQFA